MPAPDTETSSLIAARVNFNDLGPRTTWTPDMGEVPKNVTGRCEKRHLTSPGRDPVWELIRPRESKTIRVELRKRPPWKRWFSSRTCQSGVFGARRGRTRNYRIAKLVRSFHLF